MVDRKSLILCMLLVVTASAAKHPNELQLTTEERILLQEMERADRELERRANRRRNEEATHEIEYSLTDQIIRQDEDWADREIKQHQKAKSIGHFREENDEPLLEYPMAVEDLILEQEQYWGEDQQTTTDHHETSKSSTTYESVEDLILQQEKDWEEQEEDEHQQKAKSTGNFAETEADEEAAKQEGLVTIGTVFDEIETNPNVRTSLRGRRQ